MGLKVEIFTGLQSSRKVLVPRFTYAGFLNLVNHFGKSPRIVVVLIWNCSIITSLQVILTNIRDNHWKFQFHPSRRYWNFYPALKKKKNSFANGHIREFFYYSKMICPEWCAALYVCTICTYNVHRKARCSKRSGVTPLPGPFNIVSSWSFVTFLLLFPTFLYYIAKKWKFKHFFLQCGNKVCSHLVRYIRSTSSIVAISKSLKPLTTKSSNFIIRKLNIF